LENRHSFRNVRALVLLTFCGAACVTIAVAGIEGQAGVAASAEGDRVVLITLDGARTQEVFSGLDVDVLRNATRGANVTADAAYRRWWAPGATERRARLMPFFWGTLMTRHGSIAGNRALGSAVSLANRHRYSYPGYSELLVGEAHDDVIKNNAAVRNPYESVLEVLRARLNLPPARVATFGSWGVLNEIAEHRPGATLINAGVEPSPDDPPWAGTLFRLLLEPPAPWENMRLDAVTFTHAMRHLERERPRVIYLALADSDAWAHDGRYDLTLDALSRTDRYLERLWTWLQQQPDYVGRTHIIIATDHGRGKTAADWRDHGPAVVGSEEVWLAFVSPRMAQRGEWRRHPPLTNSQVAATLASWVGVDWNALRPGAGTPIK
jgi:hypothetical protein